MTLKYQLKTDSLIGGRAQNQDCCGSGETAHGLLVIVCDGMGGASGGKTASKLAVKTIWDYVRDADTGEAGMILTDAIREANKRVYQTGQNDAALKGMGTTVVALLIDPHKATAAHAGDSRIYQLRKRRKVFRTFDHSLVFELVKRGAITEEQARLSAESNVIMRAIGIKPDIDVDVTRNLSYRKGDRFLLCSDGVSGAIPEKQLLRLIRHAPTVEETVQNMMQTVDQTGKDAGGKHDNLTAALIEMHQHSILKPKMTQTAKIVAGIVTGLVMIILCVIVYLILKK